MSEIIKKHLRHGALFGLLVAAVAGVGLYVAQIGRTEEVATPVVLLPETNNIVTVAGTDKNIGDGGPATAAIINFPLGLDIDSSGNHYIGDLGNNRVRKVDANGIITTVAGTGTPGFSGDNGPATAARLNGPRDALLDSSGNLYVNDFNNSRIRKINLATGVITTVAGTGVSGSLGDNGPATAAQLHNVGDLVFDSSGNLYLSQRDLPDRYIRKITARVVGGVPQPIDGTETITTVAGNGTMPRCSHDTSINCAADSKCSGLQAGSTCLLGEGGPAKATGFNTPLGLAFDSSGNLYIGDAAARIRKVSPSPLPTDMPAGDGNIDGDPDEIITTVTGTGAAGSSGDGGPATAAQLFWPVRLAFDDAGNLSIAEENGNRIRKVIHSPLPPAGDGNIDGDPDEIITTVAGGGIIPSGDGGPATAAQLISPFSSVFDPSGNLYVSESVNNRVRKVDANGVITTVAGISTGIAGFSGDNGPATTARLSNPRPLAVDSSGNLYIGDANNNRIRKVDTNGTITTIVNTAGTAGFSGNGGAATAAKINGPRGLVFDSAGNLYISEYTNNRVRKITARVVSGIPQPIDGTEIITLVAGNGTAGSLGDGSAATAAQLNGPYNLAFDSAGNLFIAIYSGHRVRKVNMATGVITSVAGTGTAGSTGDGGAATAAQLSFPAGLVFDSAGNLIISEDGGYRVRKVDMTTGVITTEVGTGVAGFSGDGGLATAAQLHSLGLAFDSAGNLYISAFGNNRIRRLNVSAVVNVDPDTLNIASSNGKWVTAYVQLPAGRDASDIDVNSVMLQAIDPTNGALRHNTEKTQVLQVARAAGSPKGLIDTNDDEAPDQLMLKFDRATAASWAAGADELVLRVEGKFNSGRYFSGDTSVRTIAPSGGEGNPSSQRLEKEACDPELDGSCCEDPAYAEANPEACPAL